MNEEATHAIYEARQKGLFDHLKRKDVPASVITVFHSRLSINRRTPVRFSCKHFPKNASTYDMIKILATKQILIVVFDEKARPVLWTSIPGTAVADPALLFNENEKGNGRWHLRFSSTDLIACLKPIQGQSGNGELFADNTTLTQFIERQK